MELKQGRGSDAPGGQGEGLPRAPLFCLLWKPVDTMNVCFCKPSGIKISMAWNKEHLAWSSAISILDLKNCVIQAAILQITFGAEQVCPFFPGY